MCVCVLHSVYHKNQEELKGMIMGKAGSQVDFTLQYPFPTLEVPTRRAADIRVVSSVGTSTVTF